MEFSYAEDELKATARKVLDFAGSNNIFCFYGEMGAGKTTLIKAICQELGVEDAMSSPSFSIINEYLLADGGPVYHFDFYRIKDELEALHIGVEEYFYSGRTCLIEWPEKLPSLIPEDLLKININLVDESSRGINLQVVKSGKNSS